MTSRLTSVNRSIKQNGFTMSDIERRQLGCTGLLQVTVLGFRAMDLGGPPAANEIADDEAGRMLNAVLDSGINFIDTAVCYGTSEERIGRAISHRRGEFILSDQVRVPAGQADEHAAYPHLGKHSSRGRTQFAHDAHGLSRYRSVSPEFYLTAAYGRLKGR